MCPAFFLWTSIAFFLSFALVRLLLKELLRVTLTTLDQYSDERASLLSCCAKREISVFYFFMLLLPSGVKVWDHIFFQCWIWRFLCLLIIIYSSFLFPHKFDRLISRSEQFAAIMSDPTTAEEAAAKAAFDGAQSSFFLSSKLIFLLALMVPVALLGNPLLDKT